MFITHLCSQTESSKTDLLKLHIYHSTLLTNWKCKNSFGVPTCNELAEGTMTSICDRLFTHSYVCGSIWKLSPPMYNVPSKLLSRKKYNTYIQPTYWKLKNGFTWVACLSPNFVHKLKVYERLYCSNMHCNGWLYNLLHKFVPFQISQTTTCFRVFFQS